MKHLGLACLVTVFAGAVWANDTSNLMPTGDAASGADIFKKKCVACHTVADADGNKLAGRGAKSGPNLYAVAGRVAGTVDGFRYSRSIQAASAAGLMWDNDTFTGFLQDPTKYLRMALDDPRARSKMSLKLRKEQDALDVYAYLHSLAPPKDAETEN